MVEKVTKRVLFMLILLSVALRCHCDDKGFQIDGGKFIGKNDFLWFAALAEGLNDFFCSGALISRRHVLTADHCLRGKAVESFWVRIGYFCPRSDNCGARSFLNLNVIERRRDPSYGDIAIVVLERKVPSKFVPAVPDVGSKSHLSRVEKGGGMIMVGAGRDSTSGKISKQAQTLQVQLQHSNFKKCRKSISDEELKKTLVSKATICSSSKEGSPCQGDSGSALIVDDKRVGNVIVAVHSYGPRDCSSADKDDLFGHVALSKVADFVVSVVCLGNGNDNVEETWCPSSSPSPASSPPSTDATLTCDEESCAPYIDSMECPPSLPVTKTLPPSSAPVLILKADSLRSKLLHNLTNHTSSVNAVAFDATSSRLASTGRDFSVKVWDPINGGSPLMSFKLDSFCCPESVAFDPTGRFLAVDEGRSVVVLDVSDTNDATKPRQVLGKHTAKAEAVAWHPDGNMLASASDDETVRLWDAATGNVLHTFRGHRDEVESVAFEPHGRAIASASRDETIRVWDTSSLELVQTIQGHTNIVWSVAYSPDGTRIASGSWDETVRVWRASDGSPLAVFSVGFDVDTVGWSSDGKFLVSGSHDGMLRVWDATKSKGEALLEWEGHSGRVSSVAWSHNNKWIASASEDHTVKVWEMSSD